MAIPRYRPEQFVDSGWDSGTPERKARFVNSLLRFIADDFPRERFTRPLYMGALHARLLRVHRALRHSRVLRCAAVDAGEA